MSSAIEKIRQNVRDITAYTLKPIETRIKINQNENPFGMPAAIRDEVLRRAAQTDWARYPEFVPTSLLEKLASHSGWRADGVMAGNGSNEMIQSVVYSVVENGVRVVLPEPTFSVYQQVVRVAGGEIVPAPLNPELTFNIPRLASRIVTSKAHLAIICSPNNPTGCTISKRDLVTLLRTSEGLIVVDQAYEEFGGEDFVPLLREHDNLVILRTFSKAMAMGGLRVGYCLASPELIREFSKAKMPYSLNFFSMMTAEVALEHMDLLDPLVKAILAERDRLTSALQAIDGITVFSTSANFFIIRNARPAGEVFDRLVSRDILVRDVSKAPLLDNCLRISVGTPEENDRLIEAMLEIYAEESK